MNTGKEIDVRRLIVRHTSLSFIRSRLPPTLLLARHGTFSITRWTNERLML
jgi:hypothetical protein